MDSGDEYENMLSTKSTMLEDDQITTTNNPKFQSQLVCFGAIRKASSSVILNSIGPLECGMLLELFCRLCKVLGPSQLHHRIQLRAAFWISYRAFSWAGRLHANLPRDLVQHLSLPFDGTKEAPDAFPR